MEIVKSNVSVTVIEMDVTDGCVGIVKQSSASEGKGEVL